MNKFSFINYYIDRKMDEYADREIYTTKRLKHR